MISLRTKLILSFVFIVLIIGSIATMVGIYFIGEGIVQQTQDRVRTDLNSARRIYQSELNRIEMTIRLISDRFFIKDALIKNDLSRLNTAMEAIRKNESLDILTLTNKQGKVIVRARNPALIGDSQANDPLVKKALSQKQVIASTEIISKKELNREGQDLVKRVHLKFIPTSNAKPTMRREETDGMILKASVPVLDYTGNLLGVLYGGNLINRNYKIVDEVKETVFQGMRYKGKDIGATTIFQGDLRISTNVMDTAGKRAIGTRISEEVYDQVLIKGKPWVKRAFVVNNWYITAYEPIKNIKGKIIGVLYVGLLEEKFVDMKRKAIGVFLIITLIGMVLVILISYWLAGNILNPVRQLAAAAHELGKGNLDQRVEIKSKDEIGELGRTFNFMASAIKERDEQLKHYTQQIVMRSEKLAMLGQLSAGIAHEINNPLTGILTSGHILLKKTPEEAPEKEDLEIIVKEATRCRGIIRGLLDFARQTKPEIKSAKVNEIIEETISLIKNQASFHNIKIVKELSPDLPLILVDTNQIKQVFINIILNAQEAMSDAGILIISSNLQNSYLEIKFIDTGCGIPNENMDKIFDPFFTTKERGTGLGLAVSYGIIEKHQGNIKIESETGRGTTVIVKLPVTEEAIV